MKRYAFLLLAFLLVFALAACPAAAESYDASTMRLLRHEGTVEIFDVSGAPRFLMDNVRFMSGESLRTGGDGQAAVSLDDTRIVSLDTNTRVTFIQEAGHMQLNLMEGSLFLDVRKKLDENESFDIQTTTMTVGIRGTILYVSENNAHASTTIAVLEGTGRVTYTDTSGAKRVLDAPAGSKLVVPASGSSLSGVAPEISPLTAADLPDFVSRQVLDDEALTNRVMEGSENGEQILYGISGSGEENLSESFPADGDWTWGGTVTLVAQSASKLYDGRPLARPSDALVYGLPGNFSIQVASSGSVTNAGSAENVISSYSIYNASGENVTSHFTSIEKVTGTLVVDPAPLVVWTGSAEKVYDGEPLTCEDAGIRTVPGHTVEDPAWKNSSLVTRTALGSEKMVALSGRTYVHGTNPLTGETRQLELKAGQSLAVCLHEGDDGQSLEFQILGLAENELPEEVLRVYADNPDLLAQACADTGWDPDVMATLIAALPPAEEAVVASGTGLAVTGEARDNLMTDSTNVRIHIDSQITNYSTRALTEEEASFTPIAVDPSIVITATGSQTEVGESINTYTIDWGNANPDNFVLREDLGTLVVTPPLDAAVTITAASAEKVYDGTPLTAGRVNVTGLPAGYTVRASAEGTITDAGTAKNVVTYYAILNADGEDVTSSFSNLRIADGTLTVTPLALQIDCGGDTVPYSGAAFDPKPVLSYLNGGHSGESVDGELFVEPADDVTGRALGFLAAAGDTPSRPRADALPSLRYVFTLFTGNTVELTISGTGTDAGTYTLTAEVSSSIQADIDLNFTGLELVIDPVPVTVTSASAEKVYDGEPLTCEEYTVTGMPVDQEFAVIFTGTLTEVGTAENTFTVEWGALNPDNYALTPVYGTLTVTEPEEVVRPEVTITSGSAEKVYDGTALTSNEVTVTGLPEGLEITVTLTGTITDAGTAENTFTVDWGDLNPEDYDVTLSYGTLTVKPVPVTVTSASAEKVYDNLPLTCGEYAVTGMPVDQEFAVVFTGALTDAGTVENTFTVDWGDLNPEDYDVTLSYGTLTVTPYPLVFDLHGGSFTYGRYEYSLPTLNGVFPDSEVSPYVYSVDIPVGRLSVQLTVSGFIDPISDVGEYTAVCDWAYGTSSTPFSPNNYVFSVINDTATISPAEITISTEEYTRSKTYDGSPIDYSDFENRVFDVEGYEYILSYKILPITGRNAYEERPLEIEIDWGYEDPNNYVLTYKAGTFEIKKRDLVITSSPAEKVYDGKPLAPLSYLINEMVPGDSMPNLFIIKESITDVGTFTPELEVSWGFYNPDNYNVIWDLGTLTVTKRDLTVTTAHDEGLYTGEPLTNGGYDVEGLVEGETITVNVTGSQTEVGSSDNTFEITWGTAKQKNYNVISNTSSLIVHAIPITLRSASIDKTNYYEVLTNGNEPLQVTDGAELMIPGDLSRFNVQFTASINGAEVQGTRSVANEFNIIPNATSAHYQITRDYGFLMVTNEHASDPDDPITTDSSFPGLENTDNLFGAFSMLPPDPADDPDASVSSDDPEDPVAPANPDAAGGGSGGNSDPVDSAPPAIVDNDSDPKQKATPTDL